jgi:rare lipoprotein A
MKRILTIAIILTVLAIMPKDTDARNTKPNRLKQTRVGLASWYGHKSPGIKKHTANNEVFDDSALTCAIWGVGFDRKIKVTNLENGKSIVVRVNDRGPSERHVLGGRIIDLTKAAFEMLAPTHQGLVNVEIEFL